MALLYAPQKKQKTTQRIVAEIQDLDYQGLGVAKIQGKTWFIENALPTEKVEAVVTDEKRQYGLATAQKWLQESNQRVEPQCRYYGCCGGCQGQHIPVEMQRKAKEKALFSRLSKLQAAPIQLMPMICGEQWAYRRRVRLSLLWNAKNKIIEMGFRQKNSNQLVSIQQCLVAEQAINDLIPKLTALWAQYSAPKQLGHIELVSAENGIAMLLRYKGNLAETDRTLLLEFARINAVNLFLQDDQGIQLVHGEMPYYALNGIRLSFDVRDFIQVNTHLNQQMVETALDWLDLNQDDH
ncbi:MAG: 23S rRNA (uracil(1939)-C(5))-methyltransferase RlmD, partial [Haemophilus parainfluenzae]|nr:23S rRNA (uracil(1939)-C(5))-methyltransferase RlmD [Haemophilus parainfluenzae]